MSFGGRLSSSFQAKSPTQSDMMSYKQTLSQHWSGDNTVYSWQVCIDHSICLPSYVIVTLEIWRWIFHIFIISYAYAFVNAKKVEMLCCICCILIIFFEKTIQFYFSKQLTHANEIYVWIQFDRGYTGALWVSCTMHWEHNRWPH